MRPAMRPSTVLLGLVCALLLDACRTGDGSGATPATKTPACSESKPCEGGLVCDAGACVACRRDRECARNELCHPLRRRCEEALGLLLRVGSDSPHEPAWRLALPRVRGAPPTPLPPPEADMLSSMLPGISSSPILPAASTVGGKRGLSV